MDYWQTSRRRKLKPLTLIEQAKLAIYKDDPVLFVREELGETPSPDQERLLREIANTDQLYFIICAGRGAGKTKVVSWIVDWSCAVLTHFYPKYDVSVLGGSKEQSQKLYNYVRRDVYKTPLLEKVLEEEPLKSSTTFKGSEVLTHAASSTSVRGPHVELLVLDEACEIHDEIFYDALPMVTGSHHGRIIILSTPHSFYGPFQDFWENANTYEYQTHGPWPLTDCPWQDERALDMLKKTYTPERFSVEVEGKFPRLGDKMFQIEWIEKAIAKQPFKVNPNYPTDIGTDWGYYPAPTATVVIQRYQNQIQVPGHALNDEAAEWIEYGVDWVTSCKRIADFAKANKTDEAFMDNSHRGLWNHLINEHDVNVTGIWFGNDKELMQINLQNMLCHGMLRISPDQEVLLEQLRKYRVEPVRRRLGKKDEDLVDALMMACLQFVDDDLKEQHRKRLQQLPHAR